MKRLAMFWFALALVVVTISAAHSFAHDNAWQGESGEESLYEVIKSKVKETDDSNRFVHGLDLDASVVIDTFYYHDDTDKGMAHVKEEILGFGHSHGGEDHDHSVVENGFNLRHIELGLSAEVDPYFRAWTTLAIEDGNSEIEEAVIQTTSLPYGLTLSGGKFYSGIGRINRQHSQYLPATEAWKQMHGFFCSSARSLILFLIERLRR